MQPQERKTSAPTLGNIPAERAVLAGICKYGSDTYVEIAPLLQEDTFTVDHNRVLFKCLQELLKKSSVVDFASILSSAQDLSLSDYVNRPDVLKHIRAILETPIHIDNVYEHAVKIRRLQFAREIQNKLRDIYKSVNNITGNETLATIQALAEEPIQTLSLEYIKEDSSTPKLISSSLDEYLQHLIDNPATMVGISTGLPSYDAAIGGGLRRKCVDVVSSRTGVGKSVFCDNVALNVTKTGVPVLVLDTEMSEHDHYHRMLANLSGVEINEIASGQFAKDKNKFSRVLAAKEELKKRRYYYINISGRAFEETLFIIRRWLLKEVGFDENSVLRDCLVIYDYLKLMSSSEISGDLKEYQILGFQITQLHNLAVEYDFPCLTFCQLNRDGITREDTGVASGSDRIVWLCTSFSILKPKTEEEIATDGIRAGNRKLIVLKSRHGAGSENAGYTCLQMEGQYARLNHLGAVREISKQRDFKERVGASEEEDGETLDGSLC